MSDQGAGPANVYSTDEKYIEKGAQAFGDDRPPELDRSQFGGHRQATLALFLLIEFVQQLIEDRVKLGLTKLRHRPAAGRLLIIHHSGGFSLQI